MCFNEHRLPSFVAEHVVWFHCQGVSYERDGPTVECVPCCSLFGAWSVVSVSGGDCGWCCVGVIPVFGHSTCDGAELVLAASVFLDEQEVYVVCVFGEPPDGPPESCVAVGVDGRALDARIGVCSSLSWSWVVVDVSVFGEVSCPASLWVFGPAGVSEAGGPSGLSALP